MPGLPTKQAQKMIEITVKRVGSTQFNSQSSAAVIGGLAALEPLANVYKCFVCSMFFEFRCGTTGICSENPKQSDLNSKPTILNLRLDFNLFVHSVLNCSLLVSAQRRIYATQLGQDNAKCDACFHVQWGNKKING